MNFGSGGGVKLEENEGEGRIKEEEEEGGEEEETNMPTTAAHMSGQICSRDNQKGTRYI